VRFQVPQFIEVEDKIFGPFTLKQFIYLAGGIALAFIFYKFLYFWLAIPFIAVSLALGAGLAFYKINKKPLIYTVEAAFKFYLKNKLYIWKKIDKPIKREASKEEDVISGLYVPRLSDSKLKDLSWSLDIKEVQSPGAGESMKNN